MALRTPDVLFVFSRPARPARREAMPMSSRGRRRQSQALVFLVSATGSPVRATAHIRLVCGAVMAQPVENRLTRPTRHPPSHRRA